ncbi:MAG: hypothetical protein J0L66_15455 [Cytophagales bacterium]|nr:hypothetical protein [Cytophagales bacterium]
MKKLVMLMGWIVWWSVAAGQDQPEIQQDPKAVEKINALRIAYISDKLGLTTQQAEKFWPVYREYSDKRRELRQELVEARKQIKPGQDTGKDEAFVKLGLDLKQRELDLEKTYSDRLLKVITAQQILNLRKAEGEFQQLIRDQIQQRRIMQQRNETIRERNQKLREQNRN